MAKMAKTPLFFVLTAWTLFLAPFSTDDKKID